tara:strand:+ start:136108 stop:136224 length:117 start_codon:yes stop_codon:yes gene_type:complete
MIVDDPNAILVYTLFLVGLLTMLALIGLVGYVTFFKQH